MHITALTHTEEQLMQLFWKLQTFYLKEVMLELPEPKPHQNTVSTYLKILAEKEFLKTEKEGRIFRYSVIIPFEDYRLFIFRRMVENYFNGSAAEVIKLLAKQQPTEHFPLPESAPEAPRSPEKESKDSISALVHELTHPKKEKEKDKKKKKKKNKKEK